MSNAKYIESLNTGWDNLSKSDVSVIYNFLKEHAAEIQAQHDKFVNDFKRKEMLTDSGFNQAAQEYLLNIESRLEALEGRVEETRK